MANMSSTAAAHALLSPASFVLPSDVMADGEIAMEAWLDLANGTVQINPWPLR
jgi:hypothetical protein